MSSTGTARDPGWSAVILFVCALGVFGLTVLMTSAGFYAGFGVLRATSAGALVAAVASAAFKRTRAKAVLLVVSADLLLLSPMGCQVALDLPRHPDEKLAFLVVAPMVALVFLVAAGVLVWLLRSWRSL